MKEETINDTKYEVIETAFEKCPICKKGKVQYVKPVGFWSKLTTSSKVKKIICNKCNALFEEIENPQLEGIEKCYKLDLSESKEKNKYDGKTLKESEWNRGISDLDYCVKTNTLPATTILKLKVILEKGEQTHWASGAILMEERTVSYRGGGAVRVAKGVYIGGSMGTSSGEVKEIDRGNLILTNKRLLFNGRMRSSNIDLSKISIVEEEGDEEEGGWVEIGTTNRQKSQIFCLDEPIKWANYIRIAIKNSK